MAKLAIRKVAVYLGCFIFIASGHAVAQSNGCPANDDNCVQVTIPSDKSKRPEVNKWVLELQKTTQGSKTEFSFGLHDVQGVYYVIFKCQDDDPLTLDCRTPAVKKGTGDPVWVLKLTKAGVKPVEVADDLELCDSCAGVDASGKQKYNEVEFRQCKLNYCTYPYMVVDDHGERPPLDPDVIVDPR